MATCDRADENEIGFLRDADYERRDLRCENFEGVKLDRANFTQSNCRGVNFQQAHLRLANAERADFAGADFTEAQLEYCNFLGADLRGVCFCRAYLRSVIFTNYIGETSENSALLEGANFYECDLPFDLLKLGILHRRQTPYDVVGVLTPAMAARFTTLATAATERVGEIGISLDVCSLGLNDIVATWREVRVALLDTITHIEQCPEFYGSYWRLKQQQVYRLVNEVGGSEGAFVTREAILIPGCWEDHPHEWLPVLALPGMAVCEELRGDSLLAQAFNVLNERKRRLPYGLRERERLVWSCPEINYAKEFCDAENRLKELYTKRWLNWLECHPEKITLIKTLFAFCQSQDCKATLVDRAYTARALAGRYPDVVF